MQNSTLATGQPESARYGIESVTNAARILLMLRDTRELQVGKVAQALGVARSTAHRLLTTLQSQGLIAQRNPRSPYTAGQALIELGASVVGASDLRGITRQALDRIAHDTGETVHLLVLRGRQVLFVDGAEGRHAIRSALRIGAREHAHASAAGKALLSLLPSEEFRRIYPETRLTGGTPNAVRTRAALERELQQIRSEGFAINNAETENDLVAVSAPVLDRYGNALGAISISGPASRMLTKLDDYAELLVARAAEVGRLNLDGTRI